MRQKTASRLTMLIGLILIVGGIGGFNMWTQITENTKEHAEMAQRLMAAYERRGYEVLPWNVFDGVTGTFESGVQPSDTLKGYDGQDVRIVGYGLPIRQAQQRLSAVGFPLPLETAEAHSETAARYSGQKFFMFMRYPVDCYVLGRPHLKDVIMVWMAEGQFGEFAEETPILLEGTLRLREGKTGQFFYTLENAAQGIASEREAQGNEPHAH